MWERALIEHNEKYWIEETTRRTGKEHEKTDNTGRSNSIEEKAIWGKRSNKNEDWSGPGSSLTFDCTKDKTDKTWKENNQRKIRARETKVDEQECVVVSAVVSIYWKSIENL